MRWHLERLSLLHFRNHRQVQIELGPQANCFVGPNGVGKTNLLDAVHYLSMCKSYFEPLDLHNVLHGEQMFMVKGTARTPAGDDELACSVRAGERKVMVRNRKAYDRLADHVGLYPVVMITPYDGQLVWEGPEARRKFLDGLIAQFDKRYLSALLRYNRALAQRNTVLRTLQQAVRRADVEPWDEQLIENAALVHAARVLFIEEMGPLLQHHYQGISGGAEQVGLQYRSALEELDMRQLLDRAWDRDQAGLHTTAGVHKDELVFAMGEQPLKRRGSQGQQKTYLIALKLAQFDLTERRLHCKPILLLDDIFDKIDPQRMRHLLALLGTERFGQVLIADTDAPRLHLALDGLNLDTRFHYLGPNGLTQHGTTQRATVEEGT
jgi:DNA replication and repair protein RecF